MRATFIIAILLSIVITIFALSNNEYVTINYLFGEFEIAMPLLLFLLLGIGSIITLLFSIPTWWKHRQEKAALKSQTTKLTQELNTARQKILDLQQVPASKRLKSQTDDDFVKDVDKE